jgi:hypothetical protein
LLIVTAHSLVSLAFLTSDEFFELKLQRKWVFQQTARRLEFIDYAARNHWQPGNYQVSPPG